MTDLLTGKVVIVVGGLGRIGSHFVDCIIENGGSPVIADISKERYDLLKRERWNNYRIDYVNVEFTNKENILSLISYAHSNFGKIDAFVNTPHPVYKLKGGFVEEMSYEYFKESITTHLGGFFLCSQQAALYFLKQGFGNVINISSIQGVVLPKFDTYEGVIYNGNKMTSPIDYTCNKTALIAMTKYMAKYFKGKNIRFNTISPGGILDNQPKAFLEKYRGHCINKGMLDADDLKSALLFLLSDGSRFVNGQNIVVDDGFTL